MVQVFKADSLLDRRGLVKATVHDVEQRVHSHDIILRKRDAPLSVIILVVLFLILLVVLIFFHLLRLLTLPFLLRVLSSLL